MIRLVIGFLLVFGAVGGMDNGTDAQLPYQIALAVVGLILMYLGVLKMEKI
jgi:hypothetical protein